MSDWRICEFCKCRTNAAARACCDKGRDEDRRRARDFEVPAMTIDLKARERFLSKVVFGPGCWEWSGYRNHEGYGRVSIDGTNRNAHRVAYELLVGPIPAGMVLDHARCDNPACVRPSHMAVTTHRENILRGRGACAIHARKTTCPRGHAYDIATGQQRACRTCRRADGRAYLRRKRAALQESPSRDLDGDARGGGR